MKITNITTYRLPPRWMFLKIETDEGIVGWGEPVIEGRARTVEAAVFFYSFIVLLRLTKPNNLDRPAPGDFALQFLPFGSIRLPVWILRNSGCCTLRTGC